MGSPLGKYAPMVAAIVAIGIIGAYIFLLMLLSLGIATSGQSSSDLKDIALLAVGAVFTLGGRVAGENGAKASAEGAHLRLDAIAAPSTQEAAAKP